jgi:hypothetical protein
MKEAEEVFFFPACGIFLSYKLCSQLQANSIMFETIKELWQ